MTWTRETLLAAAKQYYPNVRECFLTPMVDLYLRDPEKLKDLVKADMKREAKQAKNKAPVEPRQCLFENAVAIEQPPAELAELVKQAKNIPTAVVVEDAEETGKGVAGQPESRRDDEPVSGQRE